MVTVSLGRNCSSTFKAAKRVTVPSANSSPEQATMPTFFCGRSTMLTSVEGVDFLSNLAGQRIRQLLPAFVQFRDALRLKLFVAAIDVQHRVVFRDRAAALLHHLGRTGQLAAVDRNRLRISYRRTRRFIAQYQQ